MRRRMYAVDNTAQLLRNIIVDYLQWVGIYNVSEKCQKYWQVIPVKDKKINAISVDISAF